MYKQKQEHRKMLIRYKYCSKCDDCGYEEKERVGTDKFIDCDTFIFYIYRQV